VIASRARRVTDEMFLAAARALARQTTKADLEQGSLYPALKRIRDVSAHIATAVAEVAYARHLTAQRKPAKLLAYIRSQMYEPAYPKYA
jgi:malate dehydrogenase (oxaloacetate-decarboxylating)(NADP+)